MRPNSHLPWFAEDQVIAAVRLEPAFVLMIMCLVSWIAYRVLLKAVSFERHQLFRRQFKSLLLHFVIAALLYLAFALLKLAHDETGMSDSLVPYFGLLTIASACVVLVKILRIMVFEYLFLTSMRAGVPALIANIVSLIMSLVVGGWFLSRFFAIDLTPLLATSAIFSIVLGLAMQDTLGNLFAAISLQIDKPFELGNWIEVRQGSDKISGQVQEVTWRATLLLAVTDELITIPNRIMAQSQILNFAGRRPFIRGHYFRIPYDAPLDTAKLVLLSSASSVPGVAATPRPFVMVNEAAESWITLRVVYSIFDYGAQYSIADRFLTQALHDLEEAGIPLAVPRLSIDSKVPKTN